MGRLCVCTASGVFQLASNLFSHLCTNHPKQHELASSAKKPWQATDNAAPTTKPGCSQPTIAESLSQSQKYDQNNKRWKQLTDSGHVLFSKRYASNAVGGLQ